MTMTESTKTRKRKPKAQMPQAKSENLKPCPFCAGERKRASGVNGWGLKDTIDFLGMRHVSCDDCGASGPPESTQELARNAWNHRCEYPFGTPTEYSLGQGYNGEWRVNLTRDNKWRVFVLIIAKGRMGWPDLNETRICEAFFGNHFGSLVEAVKTARRAMVSEADCKRIEKERMDKIDGKAKP